MKNDNDLVTIKVRRKTRQVAKVAAARVSLPMADFIHVAVKELAEQDRQILQECAANAKSYAVAIDETGEAQESE